MAQTSTTTKLATNWRWWMCVLLFVATTVNYMDRQVLSLTWKDFIAPEFHWTDNDLADGSVRFHRRHILHHLCHLYALCRKIRRLDGNQERIPLGYRCMELRRLCARSLRLVDHAYSRL